MVVHIWVVELGTKSCPRCLLNSACLISEISRQTCGPVRAHPLNNGEKEKDSRAAEGDPRLYEQPPGKGIETRTSNIC